MNHLFGGSPSKYIVEFQGEWVDIRPYFFVALASEKRSQKNIAEKYEKKKWEYFSYYQRSRYRNNPLLECYPIEIERAINMAIGIYEYSENTGDFEVLLSIVKFAYRDLYRFVEQKQLFDESEFQSYFMKRNKMGMASTKMYVNSLFVSLFICFTLNKNFSMSLESFRTMFGILETPNTPEKRKELWEHNIEFVQNKVEVLKEMHKLDLFKPGESIWELHAKEMTKVEQMMREQIESDSDYITQVNQRMSTLIFFGDVLEASGIDPIEIQGKIISEEEFHHILMEFTLLVDNYPQTELQFNQTFPSVFYIRQLAKMYNEAKKQFLDTTEEEKYIVVKEKEKAIAKKEEELMALERKLHKREEGLRKRLKDTEQYGKELERKNQALEKEVRELKPLQKEVSAVRSMLYQFGNVVENETLTTSEQKKQIQEKKIAFFGGHPNWIGKAKEWFPDARFLEVEDINRKLNFIKNYDVVCINTDYFNHGFYEKLMNEVSRQDVKLVYVQGATNEERVIQMLYTGIYE